MSSLNSPGAPRKSRAPIFIGLVLMCAAIGGVAFLSLNEDATYHLETANNVIRSWACPAGGYPAGRSSRGCLCKKCPAGYRCLGGSRGKLACDRGTFQDRQGQNKCKPAPRGTFINVRGATGGTPCPYGTYNNAVGKTACTRSSPGHHVPRRGARAQTKCRPGFFTRTRGNRNCAPAPRGHFVDTHGASRATKCNYGTYQNAAGKTSCRSTPRGHFAGRRGQTAASQCAANTYQGCTGQMTCIPCLPGSTSGRGSYRCTATSNTCGARAVFSFSCPRNGRYRLNRPSGISGNLMRGPLTFTGRQPSTMSNSNTAFPRQGGDLTVVVKMRFNARNRNDWIPVVNKIQSNSARHWGFWVHPTGNGRGTHLLLQRYVGTRVHLHKQFNLASRSQVFTVGFTCQARGRAYLYVNGRALSGYTTCTNMYANYPLRVGGSIPRVHSWLYGTIYKLSIFDRALSAGQMAKVMTNSCNEC